MCSQYLLFGFQPGAAPSGWLRQRCPEVVEAAATPLFRGARIAGDGESNLLRGEFDDGESVNTPRSRGGAMARKKDATSTWDMQRGRYCENECRKGMAEGSSTSAAVHILSEECTGAKLPVNQWIGGS